MSEKLVSQLSQQIRTFAKLLVQNLNWKLLQITTLIESDTHPRNMLPLTVFIIIIIIIIIINLFCFGKKNVVHNYNMYITN